MRLLSLGAVTILAIGCGSDETTTTSTTTTTSHTTTATTTTTTTSTGIADEDVNSYVPESYGPADPVRLLFMGDSITAGFGNKDGYPYTDLLELNDSNAWPEHDAIDLESLYPSLVDLQNFSVGGATTADVAGSQLDSVASALGSQVSGETIVVLTVGGNDMQFAMFEIFVGGADAAKAVTAEVLGNLQEVVDFFQDTERFPDGSYIYIANVYDPTDDAGAANDCSIFLGLDLSSIWPYFREANDAIREFAVLNDISMVDLKGHFLGHGLNYDDSTNAQYDAKDPTLWFNKDCLHPNDVGHHEVRRLYHAALEGHDLYIE